jgi:hypothetical protein
MRLSLVADEEMLAWFHDSFDSYGKALSAESPFCEPVVEELRGFVR